MQLPTSNLVCFKCKSGKFVVTDDCLLVCAKCRATIGDVNETNEDSFEQEKEQTKNVFKRYENEEVLTKIVSFIQKMSANGNIKCECGNKKLNMKLNYNGVEISCNDCSTSKFISAVYSDDLIRVRCQKNILLSKKVSKIIELNFEN